MFFRHRCTSLRVGSRAPAILASPFMNKTNSGSSLPSIRTSFSPVGFLPVRLVQIEPHQRTKFSRAGFDGPRSRSSSVGSTIKVAAVRRRLNLSQPFDECQFIRINKLQMPHFLVHLIRDQPCSGLRNERIEPPEVSAAIGCGYVA